MAEEPEINEAFLREVDDELRRSELEGFWKRWGKLVVGVVIGGLAIFGGYLWWQSRQDDQAGLIGEKLNAAFDDVEQGKQPDAEKKLAEVAKASANGYSVSAKLTQAALAFDKGDTKGAVAIYAAIAKDTSVDQPWRDLALIRQTATEYDTMKPEDVIARLKPLAVKGAPWFGSAGEMVAASYIKTGKPDLAGKMFGEMAKDELVPETIRSRAVQIAGVLGVDAVETPKEVKNQ